jgi:FKBP-type peptidyl-prolyl cis-trans isomerase
MTDVDPKTRKKSPKSVIDMIIVAIRSQPAPSANGVSRQALVKYLKSELDFENSAKIKLALKNGVAAGKIIQSGQSFRVSGDSVPEQPKKPNVDVQDEKIGTGDEAVVGDTLVVSYEGKLDDGTVFDSATSFEFQLGAGDVIKGWDVGILGMKVHGIRKLNVPSSLGYGKRGAAPEIPPNADLFFTVRLKAIK